MCKQDNQLELPKMALRIFAKFPGNRYGALAYINSLELSPSQIEELKAMVNRHFDDEELTKDIPVMPDEFSMPDVEVMNDVKVIPDEFSMPDLDDGQSGQGSNESPS